MNTPLTSLLVAASICSVAGLASSAIAADSPPPNIVLIFADDLGYSDVGCYGATKIQTPNIDKLAAEGRRFTDGHSPSAVCSPSRYGLLTGEYPMRIGISGPVGKFRGLVIDTDQLTLASLLKKKGYDTSCFGKWHLGWGEGWDDSTDRFSNMPLRPGPLEVGFDYYFGVPVVNSSAPYVYVENDSIFGLDPDDPMVYVGGSKETKKLATPITPLEHKHGNRSGNPWAGALEAHKLYNDFSIGQNLAGRAAKWIKERGVNPFFMYFATTHIHHPFTPAERFQGTSGCGLYGDFVHELDWIVGEVVKALEEKGVADNTLIIFTSDNGGMFNHGGHAAFDAGHISNGEFLGVKFDVWEGGHRVPFIAKWPGKIKPRTVSDQLISGVDMLATFAAITGQEVEPEQLADSINMLPAFIGEPDFPLRKQLVLCPFRSTHVSVRNGKWVYIPGQGGGGWSKGPPKHGAGGPAVVTITGKVNSDIEDGKIKKDAPVAQLYDLEADVNQTKNLYKDHPEIVKEMQALLDAEMAKVKPEKNVRNRMKSVR